MGKPKTKRKGGLPRHLKVLREKNIDTGVKKKDEKNREKRGEGADRIVTEVDRRSLAGLSVRTKKGEFNNDISLLLGFPSMSGQINKNVRGRETRSATRLALCDGRLRGEEENFSSAT